MEYQEVGTASIKQGRPQEATTLFVETVKSSSEKDTLILSSLKLSKCSYNKDFYYVRQLHDLFSTSPLVMLVRQTWETMLVYLGFALPKASQTPKAPDDLRYLEFAQFSSTSICSHIEKSEINQRIDPTR